MTQAPDRPAFWEGTITRDEHLAWAKARALAYVDQGDLVNAFASMVSDLDKHSKTAGHSGLNLGAAMLLAGLLENPRTMRDWIEGFR